MIMRRFVCLSAAVSVILSGVSSQALTPAQSKAIRRAMLSVPAPELPAKAVELVKQAAKEDRKDVALTALRTAIYKNRAIAPQLVAALSKELPEAASALAKTATEADSNQAGEIAHAAMTAAPTASRAEIIASVNSGYTSPASVSAPLQNKSIFMTPAGFDGTLSGGSAADSLTLRGSGGGVPTGPVENNKEPISHGPFPGGNPFHGPPPWSAGQGHTVDYSNPHGHRPF